MSPALALAAFALSSAVVLAASGTWGQPDVARALHGLGLLPLAFLPWVALAGPPPARSSDRPAELGGVACLALCLPVLALAARLDRAEGASGPELALTATGGLLLALLLARAATASGLALRLHGLLWSALVLLPPLLELVLVEVARGRAGPPAWPGALSLASPLGWLARRAADPAGVGPPYAALALCAVLLGAVRLAGRRPVR